MRYTKRRLFWGALIFLIATFYCLLLSLRPIPDINNANDTGRYVYGMYQYCSGSFQSLNEDKALEYWLLYSIFSPTCLMGGAGFLFFVAAVVPLTFLLFAKWNKVTLFWVSSLMFSVFGLELMTNAIRQSVAMFLFFFAIAVLSRHRNWGLAIGLLAIAIHSSALFFYPLLLWIVADSFSRRSKFIAILVVTIFSIVYSSAISDTLQSIIDSQQTYSAIYEEGLNLSFLVFMVMPLYWVYGLRLYFEKVSISANESRSIVFSSALLLLSQYFFPLIVFRFAFFAVALQIFLAARSESQGTRVAKYVLLGFIAHLLVMLSTSAHFDFLFYG